MSIDQNRVTKGVREGGQYAPTAHAETSVTLPAPASLNHYRDSDGTEWDVAYEDEYSEQLEATRGGVRISTTTDIRAEGARFEVVDFRGDRPSLYNRGEAGSLDEAKAAAKALQERTLKYGHNDLSVGSRSPWGTIQTVEHPAPGISSVYTRGHGGYKLSRERNKEVDPAWRTEGAWYEEDCSWSAAVITHREDFSDDHVKAAHEVARRWYPDEYEQVVGKDPERYGVTDYRPIQPGESSIRDEDRYWQAKAETHLKISGCEDSRHYPELIEVTVCEPPRNSRDNEIRGRLTVLMPRDEYATYFADGNKGAVPRSRIRPDTVPEPELENVTVDFT